MKQIIAIVKTCSVSCSILVNEATDCAIKEQMVLILTFVDKNDIIREDFVRFLKCKNGLTGAGSNQKLINF